ncbi:MAG: YD repeat-containing protein [Candidatus Azotimanducaceae bacterium]
MKKLVILPILSFLMSCSGGGSSSSSTGTPAPVQPSTGVFVDSPVAGLAFSTSSQSGVTNSAGEFTYLQNEQVSFSLGSIVLGSAVAATVVSPLDLVGATSLDEAKLLGVTDELVNRLLFLQALDEDGNPDNGIDLTQHSEQLRSETLEFAVSTERFLEGDYRKIVNRLGGQYIDPKRATNHLLSSLGQNVTVSLVVSQATDNNADGETDYIATFDYNEFGRLTEVAAQGATSSLTYDPAGNLASIEEFIGDVLISTERFEYDSFGRQVTSEKERNGEAISTVTRRYDEVGNLLEETLDSSQTFFPASPLFTEVLLASTIFIIPEIKTITQLKSDLVRAGGVGLIAIGELGFASEPFRFTNSSRFSYLEDGTLSEIVSVRNGVEQITRFDDAPNCFLAVSTPGIVPSPLFPGTALCDSDQVIERDAQGRILSVSSTRTQSSTVFVYEGNLLISQTVTNEPFFGLGTRVTESRFEYDSLDNLILLEQRQDGELEGRRTREYEQRVLTQLP